MFLKETRKDNFNLYIMKHTPFFKCSNSTFCNYIMDKAEINILYWNCTVASQALCLGPMMSSRLFLIKSAS